MKKSDLISAVAKFTENKKVAEECVDEFFHQIKTDLMEGEGDVSLPGIGKLVVKKTNERKARNPKTGESVTVPAGRKIVLKVSKSLKDSL